MTNRLRSKLDESSGAGQSGAGRGKPAAKQKPPSFNTSTASIIRAAGIQRWEAKAPWLSNAKQPK